MLKLSPSAASKRQMDRRRSLSAVPACNDAIEVERGDDGCITLLIPQPKPRWGRLVRMPDGAERPRERVELDPIGSFVWRACDAKRTVREIIEAVTTEYKFCRREGEIATVNFLRSLAKRKFIALVFLDEEKDDDAADD